MKEAKRSSETPVLTRPIRRHISEDGVLYVSVLSQGSAQQFQDWNMGSFGRLKIEGSEVRQDLQVVHVKNQMPPTRTLCISPRFLLILSSDHRLYRHYHHGHHYFSQNFVKLLGMGVF
jgi:hypothetical protein